MKALFVYAGMHPAHEVFVEAVKADVYPAYRFNVDRFRRFVEGFKVVKSGA